MFKVSVIILNWNGEGFLKQFLPILVEHTNNPDVELVVADNASIDNSCHIILEQFPQIRLIRFDKNYGFAEGYNRAIKQVNSQYIVLLNSDVEVTANWLMPIINFMDINPDTAACMPKILAYHKRTHFEHAGAAGGFIDKYGYPFCRGRIMDVTEPDNGQYNDIVPVFWATGACMFVRSSAYNQAGGLDGSFFAHMEEIDLCWRLQWLGHKIMVIPTVTVYHVGGGALPMESPWKIYLNFRNNLFLLFKNVPANQLVFTIILRMFLDGIAAIHFLTKRKFTFFAAVIKAHFHFYNNIGQLLNHRKNWKYNKQKTAFHGILNKSLIIQFFLFKKNKFPDIYHQ